MAANIKDRHALTDTDGLATITNTDDQTAAAAVAANANTTTANTNEHDLTISANKQVSIANAAEQAVTRNHPFDNTRFIHIRLPDNSLYTIHRNIAVKVSPYFGRYIMSIDPTGLIDNLYVAVHVTYPGFFNIWFRWLYSARIELEYKDYVVQAPIPQPMPPPANLQAPTATISADFEYELLSSIYVLAWQLEDITFQDAVLSAFIVKLLQPATPGFRAVPGVRAVNDIYSFTPPGSKGRALMLQVYVVKGTKDDIKRDPYHADFLQDFAVAIMEGGRPKSLELKECEYHTHAADWLCGLKKTEKCGCKCG